ncbi:MAG: SoxR reducing system RseC family protein [Bacillota bacterium]|nr:SoxR reducing system RseC family protein [Bacillota bacterium]
MEQIAKITAIYDNKTAEIEVRRQSSCGHDCGSCHGCGTPEIIHVRAINTVNASKGDTVMVSSDTGKILKLAAVSYLSPLLLFFLSYIFLGKLTGLPGGLNGAIGFFAGIAVVYFLNRRLQKSKDVVFKIKRIVKD